MIKYDHLLGREFIHGTTDCYGIIRDFYRDNFNITLTDYARPDEWWNHGMDLYMENFSAEGFELLDIHPTQYQVGDVFLMAIKTSMACHAGVYIGNGQMLHHFYGRRSNVELYKGMWKKFTCAVVRHKDVHIEPTQYQTLDFMQRIPPHLRARLEEAGKILDGNQGEGGLPAPSEG